MNAPAIPALLQPPVARPEFLPGHFPDLPAEAYHATEAMSASGAKKMIRSPAHYRLFRDTPNEPTDAMQFGTAVHCGALEPATFDARVCCRPKFDMRKTVDKAAAAEFALAHAGKIALTQDDHDRARRCIDAVLAHPMALELLTGAQVEGSLFWFDGKYGVPCKARYDARNHGGLVDLKTTADASPEAFARQAANLLYHAQAAHYMSGAEHVLDATPQFFAFVCVESEPPHAVACYTLPGNAVLAGAHLMNIALGRYAAALKSGAWAGYPVELYALKFPRYALQFDL